MSACKSPRFPTLVVRRSSRLATVGGQSLEPVSVAERPLFGSSSRALNDCSWRKADFELSLEPFLPLLSDRCSHALGEFRTVRNLRSRRLKSISHRLSASAKALLAAI
jgi:hypothetical protein